MCGPKTWVRFNDGNDLHLSNLAGQLAIVACRRAGGSELLVFNLFEAVREGKVADDCSP